MKQATCSHLAEAIRQQFHGQFQVDGNDGRCTIVTPMLYPDNSRISLSLEVIDNQHILLTDNGDAADYAFVNGVREHIVQEQIRDTIRRFNLADTGSDELVLRVEEGEIAKGIFTLVQAVLDLGYLVYRRSTIPA